MTKLDFAIHLFTKARYINTGHAHRVPVVTMLMLLVLSKQPDRWVRGAEIAEGILTVSGSTLVTCTRAALEAGLLERRYVDPSKTNGGVEWKITSAGLKIVADLLTTAAHAPA